MKIGEKVKVIRPGYEERTWLKKGIVGVIMRNSEFNNGSNWDVFSVKFDNVTAPVGDINLNTDGTYDMFRDQLEVVEADS
ncbi:hypothetical protein [Clostridium sp. KNHs205]|uniref:hypothetical protein n=1 Tax=Clostridium sp. KNHs205 TaxID=1449050 RepID=UPI00051BDEE6|nr:hypothetical protein [Clostridium sp. KNHs205]